MRAMLPDGFQWQEHMASQALFLGDRMVANYSQRPDAPYALAYFHCGKERYTGKTYGSEAIARAYIEGWARRWHVKLREEYVGHSASGLETEATSHDLLAATSAASLA